MASSKLIVWNLCGAWIWITIHALIAFVDGKHPACLFSIWRPDLRLILQWLIILTPFTFPTFHPNANDYGHNKTFWCRWWTKTVQLQWSVATSHRGRVNALLQWLISFSTSASFVGVWPARPPPRSPALPPILYHLLIVLPFRAPWTRAPPLSRCIAISLRMYSVVGWQSLSRALAMDCLGWSDFKMYIYSALLCI